MHFCNSLTQKTNFNHIHKFTYKDGASVGSRKTSTTVDSFLFRHQQGRIRFAFGPFYPCELVTFVTKRGESSSRGFDSNKLTFLAAHLTPDRHSRKAKIWWTIISNEENNFQGTKKQFEVSWMELFRTRLMNLFSDSRLQMCVSTENTELRIIEQASI